MCQPPPEVANADALMEDNDFEIGKCSEPDPHPMQSVLLYLPPVFTPAIMLSFTRGQKYPPPFEPASQLSAIQPSRATHTYGRSFLEQTLMYVYLSRKLFLKSARYGL